MEYLKEFLKFVSDSFRAPNRPHYQDRDFDDPHAHFLKPKDDTELELILRIITERVDRQSLTDWGRYVEKNWRYSDIVDVAESYRSGFKLTVDGPVTRVKDEEGEETLIYRSQEIRTKQHLHITAEGCEKTIENGLDARKTIELIHEYEGIAIVEHPCIVEHPIFQFLTTTPEQDEFTMKVFQYADAAEVFNSMNTLWMSPTNLKTKKLVEEFNRKNPDNKITAIAGTDMHYGLGKTDFLSRALTLFPEGRHFYLDHVGSAGIYLPKRDLASLTGREIIEQKRKDLREDEIEIFAHYASPLMFYRTMIPAILYRMIGMDRDSI